MMRELVIMELHQFPGALIESSRELGMDCVEFYVIKSLSTGR
jgi:hypothetical protein